ncbi:MFS transporter [Sulfuriferula plumbiphila]|uniref:MFS transporter n=1 Tax=Sulfuriferula plumbiphila TaxID=171865 RepID=A0A512LAL6_9PROT|nr:MFS transporter [Sulfuriferula plumbiphila]BBP03401.1 MFS transporter [Sulfuriferula plumbiphila]GEP31517.1 MFS transporter [Sulfuriferula plumbiphila]
MQTPSLISPRLVGLLAVAAGATVANLYYSQPLLVAIAADIGVRPAAVSVVPTATQLGYAAGLLLLVPLGDSMERRRLIVATTLCAVLMLLGVALAPTLGWLMLASFLLGAVSVVPQLAVPFAAHLAAPDQRGRVIGIVMSGLLVGILLSRTLSGLIGAYAGWRDVYLLAIGVMLMLAVLLQRTLPRLPSSRPIAYTALLASLIQLVRSEPVLRRHALVGGCGFAAFSVFWTTLAFHLHQLSPGYGSEVAGMFGLIGVTGALVAPLAGRLADRVAAPLLNGAALLLVLLAFLLMGLTGTTLLGLALGVVLLDAGVQASHLSNQARIYTLHPDLRNRLNAVYMVTYFLGGAAGSALGGYAWQHAGWPAVCAVGAGFAAAGILALFAVGRADPAPH